MIEGLDQREDVDDDKLVPAVHARFPGTPAGGRM